jgi:nitrate reductase NapD
MSTTRRSLLPGLRSAGSQEPDFHICSLVVHARPENLAPVRDALGAISGIEIHAESPTGKLVVTMEALNDDEVVRTMAHIGELPGVLSTALIFQHTEQSA